MAEQLDIESVFKFKVEELKQELGKRGLTKNGSKADLQERLLQYVTNKSYTKEYEIAPVNDIIVDDEKLKESSEKSLGKSDALEDCLDESEMVIANFDGTKNLVDEIIDTVVTPNDDNVSIPIDEDVDDDDVDDDMISEKTVIGDNIENTDSIHNDIVVQDYVNEIKVPKAKVISLSMTVGQKKENRSKRFGEASSETEKKKARLGRFFSSVSGLGRGEPVTEEDVEKIKKRVERFGAVSTILTKPENSKDRLKVRHERFADTNLKKRQERFGAVYKQSLNLNSDMDVRKKDRLSKFGAV